MSASSVVLRLRATVAVAAVCFTYGLAAPENARAQIGSDRYAAIVARYPDDVDAWYELGDVAFHHASRLRRFVDARPAFERAVALAPGHVDALVHLARIYGFERRLGAFDTATRQALAYEPAGNDAAELQALRAAVLDDRAAADAAEDLPEGRPEQVLLAA